MQNKKHLVPHSFIQHYQIDFFFNYIKKKFLPQMTNQKKLNQSIEINYHYINMENHFI